MNPEYRLNPETSVVISVLGGVAEVVHARPGITVSIVDWDNLDDGECPNCGDTLAFDSDICPSCGFDVDGDCSQLIDS